jgi:hypothetical protein
VTPTPAAAAAAAVSSPGAVRDSARLEAPKSIDGVLPVLQSFPSSHAVGSRLVLDRPAEPPVLSLPGAVDTADSDTSSSSVSADEDDAGPTVGMSRAHLLLRHDSDEFIGRGKK